jgi:N-acetylglucosaminyl-diphospho-decaprenol L-rhamnosyltransferase
MQMNLVVNLLDDIDRFCSGINVEVILTLNTGEEWTPFEYSYPLFVIKNETPKGFGENHNQAFKSARGEFFCVLNPDIRLNDNPFPPLLECLKDDSVGVVAPVILNDLNLIEDSARRFPSPLSIFLKLINKILNKPNSVRANADSNYDWVGGMFMFFNVNTYREVRGFDQRYFMYYEDVDICARLTHMGKQVLLCQTSRVVHLAQRASHRNMRHLRWHLTSMLRFFMSGAYWRLLWR